MVFARQALIRHLSLLIDASKEKEVEIEGEGEMNPFPIYSVNMMSLADSTWVSLVPVGFIRDCQANQPAIKAVLFIC